MTITFANQKGGVGKTSLLILFSHYLSALRKDKILMIDADHQRSLLNQRKVDQENFPDCDFGGDIIELNLEEPSVVGEFMEELRGETEPVLIDAPGNLTEPGLIQVLAYSDVIVVPYQYENKVLESSGTFISVIAQLREKLEISPKLFFVPNRIKTGVGLKNEKSHWAEIDEIFARHGTVTPLVKDLVCFSRVNTITITKEQSEQTKNCFDLIYTKVWQEK